jgi:hypothetical protein
MALLATWAVVFQAGEPISRGFQGTIEGRHTRLSPPPHVPRVSLHITSDEKANYEAVVRHIESNAGPNEKLMTIPMDPELNFITGRKSPVWYYGTPLGLREDRDVARSLERLVAESPLFVVHRRDDKYLTDLSAQLLNDIRARCPAPIAIGPFDIYRLPVPFHRPFPRSPDPG